MIFWDSSAIIPLLIRESRSKHYHDRLKASRGQLMVWWGSFLECVSAIARKTREGALTEENASQAIHRLELLRDAWVEVEPSETLRKHAVRILRNHDLRAADAMQLAAAWVLANHEDPSSITIYTDDEKLRQAALQDGFHLA